MNEEFELRKRIQDSDPAGEILLNESVVAQAALGKAPRFSSFRVARLTMAAASLSIVGLAVTAISLPQSQQPLFTLSQSGPGGSALASAESTAMDGKMAADSMMIWPGFIYNYIPGDLDKSTGRGKVYQAELVGDPWTILKDLASKLGVEGEPKRDEWASDEYPSYSIQGENASLGIYFSGSGNWYYSSWSDRGFSCAGSSSSEDSGITEEYCEPKPTPELIPNEGDLLTQATQLFADLGISVDSAKAKVWRDEWGASVSFPNIQSGINTGMDYYIGWAMDGSISYVSGHSFRLVERGEFNTISAFDAVARISDGRWYGGAPSSYYEDLYQEDGFASPLAREATSELAVEPQEPADGEKIEIIEPEPAPEYQEPVVQDLLVVKSEAVMLSVFDAGGNFWFVPGHLLYNDQGWFDSIISLEEGIIELPEPFNYDVMPLEEPLG